MWELWLLLSGWLAGFLFAVSLFWKPRKKEKSIFEVYQPTGKGDGKGIVLTLLFLAFALPAWAQQPEQNTVTQTLSWTDNNPPGPSQEEYTSIEQSIDGSPYQEIAKAKQDQTTYATAVPAGGKNVCYQIKACSSQATPPCSPYSTPPACKVTPLFVTPSTPGTPVIVQSVTFGDEPPAARTKAPTKRTKSK